MTLATEPRPAESDAVVGCCWDEKPIGGSRTIRCGDPVVPGRPWCEAHLSRFQRGKALSGRSRL
jgi:hypothetical protein